MSKVVIVGAGVSGLVANYVFRMYGVNPTVLEPGTPGGEFPFGGLKYIHCTTEMEDMFDDLNLPWSDYNISGGILLRGHVKPYPRCFEGMAPEEAARIQADHYRKTRRMEPGVFGSKSMNDPAAKPTRRAIRCDFSDMISRLAARANIVKESMDRIVSRGNHILTTGGKRIKYDQLIVTIPLWAIRGNADFYVPQGMAMALNIAQVDPMRDRYSRWDYVYTPYTPGNAIHRFSPSGSGYSVEVNGNWDDQIRPVLDDLAFIFDGSFVVRTIKKGLKGHLLDLQEKPAWPDNVTPLGRFAQWDPRATTDTTCATAHKLARQWWGDQVR